MRDQIKFIVLRFRLLDVENRSDRCAQISNLCWEWRRHTVITKRCSCYLLIVKILDDDLEFTIEFRLLSKRFSFLVHMFL